MGTLTAVIFDLGGVVLGSPLEAIAAYERETGLPPGFVNRVVADTAPTGAWSRLERGELGLAEFYPAFESDCRAAGHGLSARDMMAAMEASATPRPQMLGAIAALREGGYRVAALTNNWAREGASGAGSELRSHFDVFVESSVVGLRKPDPAVYRHTCRALGIEPPQAAFLDDIGSNLKAARALGMTTIRVADPDVALNELAEALGLPRLHL